MSQKEQLVCNCSSATETLLAPARALSSSAVERLLETGRYYKYLGRVGYFLFSFTHTLSPLKVRAKLQTAIFIFFLL